MALKTTQWAKRNGRGDGGAWALILKSMQADENYCCWLMGLCFGEQTVVVPFLQKQTDGNYERETLWLHSLRLGGVAERG